MPTAAPPACPSAPTTEAAARRATVHALTRLLKASTASVGPMAVESLGSGPAGTEADLPSQQDLDEARKGLFGDLVASFRLAPKGFMPIPGSRHGGYHKQVNGRWVTWYPSAKRAHRDLHFHNHRAVKHYYDHHGEDDKGVRQKHVSAFIHHTNVADGAEDFLRRHGKLKQKDLPENPLRGVQVRVTKDRIQATGGKVAASSARRKQSKRATQRADEEQASLHRSPAQAREGRRPRAKRGEAAPPTPSKRTRKSKAPATAAVSEETMAAIRKSPGRALRGAVDRPKAEARAISQAVHAHDPEVWQRLAEDGWLTEDMMHAVREDKSLAKAARQPGLSLRPTARNPRVKRWQRVHPDDVHAGAHFELPTRDGLRVHETNASETVLSWGDSRNTWRAPTASVPQLVHDLRGELRGRANSGDPAVDDALAGRGAFLGKGDQGVVHRVGAEVVKAATVAPFHPENGVRTLQQANALALREQAAHHALAGHPVIPEVRHVHHEGRAYLVKPYLEPAGRLSKDELEQVQDLVDGAHGQGWVIGDELQVGRDPSGQIKLMDLGMARPSEDRGHQEDDHLYLDRLFAEHNQERQPKGRELQRDYERARMLLTGVIGLSNPHARERTWANFQRVAEAKGRALLREDRDDDWDQLQDEVDGFRRQLEEERARSDTKPAAATG